MSYAILLILSITGCFLLFNTRINFKLIMHAKKFNFIKLFMWIIEILQFPLLINIVNTGLCDFKSEKAIIIPVDCYARTDISLTPQE